MSRGARLSEEARFELAMTAGSQERRNRPVALLAGATAVLLAAAVFALVAVSARGSAVRERQRGLSDQAAVGQMVEEWGYLSRQEGDLGGPEMGQRMDNLLSRMETLSSEAGMKNKPVNPITKTENRPGIRVIEYPYRGVKDDSLKALMEWVRMATSSIPGMEVTELKLRPDPTTGWTMDVTFRRWERAG